MRYRKISLFVVLATVAFLSSETWAQPLKCEARSGARVIRELDSDLGVLEANIHFFVQAFEESSWRPVLLPMKAQAPKSNKTPSDPIFSQPQTPSFSYQLVFSPEVEKGLLNIIARASSLRGRIDTFMARLGLTPELLDAQISHPVGQILAPQAKDTRQSLEDLMAEMQSFRTEYLRLAHEGASSEQNVLDTIKGFVDARFRTEGRLADLERSYQALRLSLVGLFRCQSVERRMGVVPVSF